MKFFGQLWFILVACQDDDECNNPSGVCTGGVCECEPEYTGTVCELDNPCKDETCSNQGTCKPSDATVPVAVCTCNPGFTGTKCETDIDECAASGTDAPDCNENAACTNTPPGSYTCTCNEGFSGDGKTCTEGVCSAGGNECANGGTCVTSTTPTTCTCADGYTGDTCQNAGGTVKISGFLMTLTVLTFFVIL